MANKDFEVPEALRDMAQKNVDQAREAYERFLDTSRQARDMLARSSEAMGSAARDLQRKALEFTEANTKAGFELAERLTGARTVQEALEIQADFARRQMETYAKQAQELSRLMAKSAKP